MSASRSAGRLQTARKSANLVARARPWASAFKGSATVAASSTALEAVEGA